MKFEISSEILDTWNMALKTIEEVSSKGISKITGVIITAKEEEQEIRLYISTGGTGVPIKIVSTFDGIVYKEGVVAVNPLLLSKLGSIDKSDESIVFKLNLSKLNISSGKRKSSIPIMSDIYNLEEIILPPMMTISSTLFNGVIKALNSGITRKDEEETLSNVSIIPINEGTVLRFFTATHHVMSIYDIDFLGYLTKPIAIHKTSLKPIMHFTSTKNKEISWGVDDNSIYFKSNATIISLPLSTPKHLELIGMMENKDLFKSMVAINKEDLISQIKKGKEIYTLSSLGVKKITGVLNEKELTISTEEAGIEFDSIIECQNETYGSGQFIVQARYIEESLRNIDDAIVSIFFNDTQTVNYNRVVPGIVLTGFYNQEMKTLIMQLRQ